MKLIDRLTGVIGPEAERLFSLFKSTVEDLNQAGAGTKAQHHLHRRKDGSQRNWKASDPGLPLVSMPVTPPELSLHLHQNLISGNRWCDDVDVYMVLHFTGVSYK